MVAVSGVPALLGSQSPRIQVLPDGVDHPRWDEVVEFVDALGVVLDPWQWLVLRASLMRTQDLSLWAAFAVAVCAPRQNGKNGILEIRELIGPCLLGEKLVIHSAHLADTSKEGFRRLDDLIDANDWLSAQVRHVWRTNGHESIEFTNGCRIRFRTRTRGGGRGFSGSPVIYDEAMYLPEVSMGSMMPVISAQPDPQIWYMGSAVDQTIMEDGIVFARVRDRALSENPERLAYFEWSLDAESPDQLELELPRDLPLLAAANPAVGLRISPDYLEAEWRELDARTHAVERGGVGDWPPTDGSAAAVINLDDWQALSDPGSSVVDPVFFAFDVTPDRSSSSIGVAGRRADGFLHVELVERRPGTAWVAGRISELCKRHKVAGVCCDAVGPVASLLPALEQLGVEVQAVTARDHANACGLLFDAVMDASVRHLGQSELRHAIRGAVRRPLGDAWAWSRRNSAIDISPLVACTLALWGAATVPKVEVFAMAW